MRGREGKAHPYWGYVMESTVEANVLAWLTDRELRLSAEIATASKTPRTVKKIESVDIDAKLAVVASRLDSLSERLIDSDIPHDSYVRLRDKYLAEQQALRQARLTVTVQAKVEPIRVIPVLLENWHLGKVEEKREILRALIDHVEVFPDIRALALWCTHANRWQQVAVTLMNSV